ncbi:MAG: hypothetical protein OES84_03515 [Kiritimatiellaceae bacterium]|nr:hypothetical protein [Kiritimatiellaceae bacterium]
MDEQFLQDRAYPYCKGIADALVGLMEPDKNGKLKLPLSSSPEIHNNTQKAWLKPNSNFDLSLIRWLLGANAEMATALGKKEEAARWKTLLGKMDELAVDGKGALLMAQGEPLKGSHRHFSHLMAIQPLGIISTDGDARQANIVKSSLDETLALGTKQWTGYSFSWMACLLARAGDAERAEKYLNTYLESFILRNGFHCNGEVTDKGWSQYRYQAFTLEGNFAAGQAVHEMLLQTWGHRIRIFPATPEAWADVSFDTLRGEGGFIVSAVRSEGKTISVTVKATVDGPLRLEDPFGGEPYTANFSIKRSGDDLICQMKAGQMLELKSK